METIIDGLQGRGRAPISTDHVLATAKHYAGDGDTEYDAAAAAANVGKPWCEQRYTIDQGITVTSRRRLRAIDLAPYAPAIRRHDVGSVMPSFSSVDWTEDGVGNPIKMHAHRELITDVLKGEFRFDGFVISDWEGIHQIPDPANPGDGGLTAVQGAGRRERRHRHVHGAQHRAAVRGPAAGRGQRRPGQPGAHRRRGAAGSCGRSSSSGSSSTRSPRRTTSTRSAARRTGRSPGEAVAKSQVLLKNDGDALPLRPTRNIYVAGRNADNIGNQAGGWTIDWQGVSGDIIPGTTILEGIREVAPQADGHLQRRRVGPDGRRRRRHRGRRRDAVRRGLRRRRRAGVRLLHAGAAGGEVAVAAARRPGGHRQGLRRDRDVRRAVVVSGRPQVLTDQLDEIDALVASWLPGSEGAGVADVLFGRRPFTGRLR